MTARWKVFHAHRKKHNKKANFLWLYSCYRNYRSNWHKRDKNIFGRCWSRVGLRIHAQRQVTWEKPEQRRQQRCQWQRWWRMWQHRQRRRRWEPKQQHRWRRPGREGRSREGTRSKGGAPADHRRE